MFMAAWVREEKKWSENRRCKRGAEEEQTGLRSHLGVTVGNLRQFRVALIGPTQGLPKRRRLRR